MENVKRFLIKQGMTPEIAEMALKDAYGLISEGWTVEMGLDGLVFTTPTLTWWGNGVTSSSRYEMRWDGWKNSDGWRIQALDRKPHWPYGYEHPNVPHYPCMGSGGSHPSVRQPNPFVAARSIASMISGSVLSRYNPHLFGDTKPGPLEQCAWCYSQAVKSNLIWKGSQYYHPRCYEVKRGR